MNIPWNHKQSCPNYHFSFAAAIHNHSKFDTGNGAVVMKNQKCFWIISPASRHFFVELDSCPPFMLPSYYNETAMNLISYLFTFVAFGEVVTRVRNSNRITLLSFELYKFFKLSAFRYCNGLHGEYGYWSIESIIILLHEDVLSINRSYRTYDPRCMVEGMLEQRHRDLDSLMSGVVSTCRNSRELPPNRFQTRWGWRQETSLVGPFDYTTNGADNKKA